MKSKSGVYIIGLLSVIGCAIFSKLIYSIFSIQSISMISFFTVSLVIVIPVATITYTLYDIKKEMRIEKARKSLEEKKKNNKNYF